MTPRLLPFPISETVETPAETPALSVVPGGLAALPSRKKTLVKTAAPRAVKNILPVDRLDFCAGAWLSDCEMRQHSPETLLNRKRFFANLRWWTAAKNISVLDTATCRLFLAYVATGHAEPGGRWGNLRFQSPVKPETVATYHRILRTFFLWLVTERFLDASPLETVKAPVARRDQIEPLAVDQVELLLLAAKKSREAPRNEAVVMLLWDTGIRVSELCGLRLRDLDMGQKSISVLGKGNKRRKVHFGKRCAKALWNYIGRARGTQEGWKAAMDGADFGRWDSDAPLFASEGGIHKGERLERNAVLLILKRLSTAAGITGISVTPHTMRHTFAVSFLRAGGSVFALMEVLGHTDLKMSRRYVTFADADIASQGRFSPADAGRKG